MKKLLFTCFALGALQLVTGCYKDDEYNEKEEVKSNTTVAGYYTTTFTAGGTTSTWKDGENGVIMGNSGTALWKTKKREKKDSTITDQNDTVITITRTMDANYQSGFTSSKTKEKLVFTMDTTRVTDSYDSVYHRPDVMNRKNVGLYIDGTSIPADSFNALFTRTTPVFRTSTKNGMSIEYTDNTGKVWSTASGAQTNPVFKVTSIEKGTLGGGIPYVKGNVTFDCTVYNGGTSKSLKGTAKMFFVNSK